MAASNVDICNEALLLCGQKETIDSLDDDTTPAELCKKLYDATLLKTLAAAPWPFARRRSVLSLLSETRTEWKNVYEWPSDCVSPRYITTGVRPGQPVSSYSTSAGTFPAAFTLDGTIPVGGFPLAIPFRTELGLDGATKVICTDQDQAELIYTALVTATVVFPPRFEEALTLNLARKLARALPVKEGLAQALGNEYRQEIAGALAEAFRSEREDPPADAKHIAVRG